jgi:hypothetical protein
VNDITTESCTEIARMKKKEETAFIY